MRCEACGDPLDNDGKGYDYNGTSYCYPCFDRIAPVAVPDDSHIRRIAAIRAEHDPAYTGPWPAPDPPRATEPPRRRLQTRTADASRARPFEWAWDRRLLVGYINLLVGDEGIGKSTFVNWLMARLTRGDLPGQSQAEPMKVLIIGDEDSFDRVTVPRLAAVNADLTLVHDLPVVDDQPLDIRRDINDLRTLIRDERFGFVYFEQLLDNLGPDVDDYRSKEVRAALGGLRRLVDELQIVTLATLHTNKLSAGGFRQRAGGTSAFNQLSRSSLWLAEHPENPDLRVLVRGKGNYSAPPTGLEFSIESRTVDIGEFRHSVGVLAGLVESNVTREQLEQQQDRRDFSMAAAGRQIIRDELADGEWHEAEPILELLADAGLNRDRAGRLATELRVQRHKTKTFPAAAVWRLAGARARGEGLSYESYESDVSAISTENAETGETDTSDSADKPPTRVRGRGPHGEDLDGAA